MLSFANQIASYTSIRNTIKELSKMNRRQVALDAAAIVGMITIVIIHTYGYQHQLKDAASVIIVLAMAMMFFSGLTFARNFHRMNHFKNKAMDLED